MFSADVLICFRLDSVLCFLCTFSYYSMYRVYYHCNPIIKRLDPVMQHGLLVLRAQKDIKAQAEKEMTK